MASLRDLVTLDLAVGRSRFGNSQSSSRAIAFKTPSQKERSPIK